MCAWESVYSPGSVSLFCTAALTVNSGGSWLETSPLASGPRSGGGLPRQRWVHLIFLGTRCARRIDLLKVQIPGQQKARVALELAFDLDALALMWDAAHLAKAGLAGRTCPGPQEERADFQPTLCCVTLDKSPCPDGLQGPLSPTAPTAPSPHQFRNWGKLGSYPGLPRWLSVKHPAAVPQLQETWV